MSTQSHRAIHKETSPFRFEEIQCLLKQHGAMGRAHAPQRRSHHHRPVISFKELDEAVLCTLNFVLRDFN